VRKNSSNTWFVTEEISTFQNSINITNQVDREAKEWNQVVYSRTKESLYRVKTKMNNIGQEGFTRKKYTYRGVQT